MPDITRELTEVSVLPISDKGLLRLLSHWDILTTEFYSSFPFQGLFPFAIQASKLSLTLTGSSYGQFRSLQADAPSYSIALTSASPSLPPYQQKVTGERQDWKQSATAGLKNVEEEVVKVAEEPTQLGNTKQPIWFKKPGAHCIHPSIKYVSVTVKVDKYGPNHRDFNWSCTYFFPASNVIVKYKNLYSSSHLVKRSTMEKINWVLQKQKFCFVNGFKHLHLKKTKLIMLWVQMWEKMLEKEKTIKLK